MVDSSVNFDALYRRFEDEYRGSQALISDRLKAYTPIAAAIESTAKARCRALDLGMGRGEWLRQLKARNWEVTGVDLNPAMTSVSELDAHEVVIGDALAHVQKSPNESFDLVTSFHLIEHLERDYLIDLIREVERVLVPGGIALFETPNPENLRVSSWTFYMDPTHEKPLPPLLLQFYMKQFGFASPLIFRLNGPTLPVGAGHFREILSNLFLASPDYAVIATKKPELERRNAWKKLLEARSQVAPSDIQKLLAMSDSIDAASNAVGPSLQARLETLETAMSTDEVEGHLLLKFEQLFRSLEMQIDAKHQSMEATLKREFERLHEIFCQGESAGQQSAEKAKQNASLAPANPISAENNIIRGRFLRRWNRLKRSIRKRTTATYLSQRRAKLMRSIAKRLPFTVVMRRSSPSLPPPPMQQQRIYPEAQNETITSLRDVEAPGLNSDIARLERIIDESAVRPH